MPTDKNLRPYEKGQIKPKRTSYDEMSIWLKMREIQKTEILHEKPNNISPTSDTKNFMLSNHFLNDLSSSIIKNIQNSRYHYKWSNVKESRREDGKRLLFIDGVSRSYENISNKHIQDFGSYVHEYAMPPQLSSKINQRKLDIDTIKAVESGNWNIMR